MPVSEMMLIPDVSIEYKIPEATIRWWISTGTEMGPLFARVGKRRMARRSDVERWIDNKFVGDAA